MQRNAEVWIAEGSLQCRQRYTRTERIEANDRLGQLRDAARIVEEPNTSAHTGLCISSEIVSKAQSRREVPWSAIGPSSRESRIAGKEESRRSVGVLRGDLS